MKRMNMDDKIRQVFDGFEPEVKGRWERVKSELEHQSFASKSEMLSRIRLAERFAIAATAVAAGLTLVMISPTIFSSSTDDSTELMNPAQIHDEISAELEGDMVANSHVQGVLHSTVSEELLSDGKTQIVYLESAARTSTTVRVLGEGDVGSNSSGSALLGNEEEPADHALKNGEKKHLASTDGKDLNRKEAPHTLTMSSSVQEACQGTEVSFALGNRKIQGSILWNFGDGSFSQESTPTHVFDRAGTYDITVSVRSHGNGIIRTKSIENMIVVRPKPTAMMDWDFALDRGEGIAVNLIDKTEGVSSSTWVLLNQGLEGSKVVITEPAKLPVNLIVSNAFGCQDIASGNIEIGDRLQAGAPAMFSPNGDGRYDTFLPESANDLHKPWVFSVFSVAGQLVFESANSENPWKGQLNDGTNAAIGGRFFWNLELTNPDGSKSICSDEVRIDG